VQIIRRLQHLDERALVGRNIGWADFSQIFQPAKDLLELSDLSAHLRNFFMCEITHLLTRGFVVGSQL